MDAHFAGQGEGHGCVASACLVRQNPVPHLGVHDLILLFLVLVSWPSSLRIGVLNCLDHDRDTKLGWTCLYKQPIGHAKMHLIELGFLPLFVVALLPKSLHPVPVCIEDRETRSLDPSSLHSCTEREYE